MKTDRFTDIIRRKLESIRPEFTDKDWARMHDTLKNANLSQPNVPNTSNPFSGGVWSGKSWLLAAASVSTAALITYSIWQQREINSLRQTLGQLNQKSTTKSAPIQSNPGLTEQIRPDLANSDKAAPSKRTQETNTSPNRNEGQSERPDTVYITRYVPTPSRKGSDIRTEEHLSQRVETPAEQSTETSPLDNTRQSTTLTHNPKTESHDASSTPSVAKNTNNESGSVNKSTNLSTNNKELGSQNVRVRNRKRNGTSPSNTFDNTNNVAANNGAGRNVNNKSANNGIVNNTTSTANSNLAAPRSTANTNVATGQTESPAIVNETSASYEMVAGLPLSIDNKNWNAALAQYAKRMRPARAAVVAEPVAKAPTVVEQAPESQPVNQLATRFRVGAGGEIASRLWSAGVVTEVLFDKHWALSVGLSQATYTNTFSNDEDFDNRTKRDFRSEFGRDIAPWRDITNIDTRQQRIQLPITLGYRIPLNSTLTLLPTVGTYFTLTNSEDVTFYCRKPQVFPQQAPRGYEQLVTSKSQSVDLINSLSFGAGIEWQRSHWVVQASPTFTISTLTDPKIIQSDLNWQKNSTVGLRARLLYQF